MGSGFLPAAQETTLRNQGGGLWNHELFWKVGKRSGKRGRAGGGRTGRRRAGEGRGGKERMRYAEGNERERPRRKVANLPAAHLIAAGSQ